MAQDRTETIKNKILFESLMAQGCAPDEAAKIADEGSGVPPTGLKPEGPGAIDEKAVKQSVTPG